MIVPSTSTIVTVVLAPLLAWRVYVRFRLASGRQRLSRYRAPITLTLYALIIAAVALANASHPAHLVALVLTLSLGAWLAIYALKRTQFEPTPQGLFYTPHSRIGIALAVLFVARLLYRFVEVYVVDTGAARSAAEFAQSPLTIGAFGLLAGYYVRYTIGLARWRHRVLKAKRAREAARGDA